MATSQPAAAAKQQQLLSQQVSPNAARAASPLFIDEVQRSHNKMTGGIFGKKNALHQQTQVLKQSKLKQAQKVAVLRSTASYRELQNPQVEQQMVQTKIISEAQHRQQVLLRNQEQNLTDQQKMTRADKPQGPGKYIMQHSQKDLQRMYEQSTTTLIDLTDNSRKYHPEKQRSTESQTLLGLSQIHTRKQSINESYEQQQMDLTRNNQINMAQETNRTSSEPGITSHGGQEKYRQASKNNDNSDKNLNLIMGNNDNFAMPEPVHNGIPIIQKTPSHSYDKDAPSSTTSREQIQSLESANNLNTRLPNDYDDYNFQLKAHSKFDPHTSPPSQSFNNNINKAMISGSIPQRSILPRDLKNQNQNRSLEDVKNFTTEPSTFSKKATKHKKHNSVD